MNKLAVLSNAVALSCLLGVLVTPNDTQAQTATGTCFSDEVSVGGICVYKGYSGTPVTFATAKSYCAQRRGSYLPDEATLKSVGKTVMKQDFNAWYWTTTSTSPSTKTIMRYFQGKVTSRAADPDSKRLTLCIHLPRRK